MIFYVITSASFLLPHYVMGLVLLAPPGVRFNDDDDMSINLVDLDDAYDGTWAIPISLLDRPVSLPEQGDGTLTKDTLPRRASISKRHFKRHHRSNAGVIHNSSDNLVSEVGSVPAPYSNQLLKRLRRSYISHLGAKSIQNALVGGEQRRLGWNVPSIAHHLFHQDSSQSNNSRETRLRPSSRTRHPFTMTSRQAGSGSGYLLSGRDAHDTTGSGIKDLRGSSVEDLRGSSVEDLRGSSVKDPRGSIGENLQGSSVGNLQGSSVENLQGSSVGNLQGSSVGNLQSSSVGNLQGSSSHDLSENRMQDLLSRAHLFNHLNDTTFDGDHVMPPASHGATKTHDRRRSRHKRWASIKRIKLSHNTKIGPTQPPPMIVRRRTRVDAKVGVLVVVENSIYRQYLLDNSNDPKAALARIRRYYGMVFALMEQRFATINDPHISISVRISGILVAEKREESSWLEHLVDWSTLVSHGMGSVHTDKALKKFAKWVSGRRNLPEFDHAMVFTAYRLTIKQGISLGGMAYLNAICDTSSGNAVSIVADRGDFQCVKVATHELAHSLGANHDGDKQSKTCRPDSNFIMSAQPSHEKPVLKNAFYFSPCSIREMSIHLSKPSSACVKNEPTVYYTYDLKRLPPGQVYSADMQCKLIFGKKSEFCREGNVLDVICGQLWCKDPQKPSGCRTNSYLTALPGTACGANRICHIGECILDTKKNAILNDNMSGSIDPIPRIRQRVQPSFRMRGPRPREHKRERPVTRHASDSCTADRNKKYCEGLMKVNPGGCRRRAVRQYCCATCNSQR